MEGIKSSYVQMIDSVNNYTFGMKSCYEMLLSRLVVGYM